MTNEHDHWLTVTYSGVVAFCIPPSATHQLLDNTTICVTDMASDVLASLFPLRQSSGASLALLERELRDFTQRCVRPRVGIVTATYARAVDVDFPGVLCLQCVLAISPDRMWIARAYARDDGDEMLLVHWNGLRDIAPRFPVPLLVSLIPLFALRGAG